MENFENELIEMFNGGNDNYYGEGERVEELWLDDEYNDKENYDEEFVDGWNDLKNRLKNGNIVNDEWDVEINFELKGKDILMWFIEGKE